MASSGYKEKLFFKLSAEEKDKFLCSICYNILRDPYQCKNGHQFCYYCITTWTQTGLGHQDACPSCRVKGGYKENRELKERIDAKVVRCEWKKCFWTGVIKELDTHAHTIYIERTKNDAYQSSSLNTDRSTRGQRSSKTNKYILERNRAISERIQRINLGSRERNERIYKQLIESEWRKIHNEERFRNRQRINEANIIADDRRLIQRLNDVESRKRKEIEENRRRVKSYEIKLEQHRETSSRRFHRHEREIGYENQLMWHRIERQRQRRESDKQKAEQKRKEMVIFVRKRTGAFLRKLDRENREWKDKLAVLLDRIGKTNRDDLEAVTNMHSGRVGSERKCIPVTNMRSDRVVSDRKDTSPMRPSTYHHLARK